MIKKYLWLPALAVAAATASSQNVRVVTPATARTVWRGDDSNSPRIGVYLGESNIKDTAGVLVNSVIKDSPADKAGIKDGDRISAINGVNLKMSRDDADDPALNGMMTRRLTRELDKLKAGDEVDLRITSGSSPKSVKVKTVAAKDLHNELAFATSSRLYSNLLTDRAALGISLGGSATKRDTLGVFVAAVTTDGPAEKAGIVEGDRIAKVNGVDLRVQSPEAGESDMSRAMVSRFTREINKLKAGDAATLTVVSGGRSREVKVTAVKATELHGMDGSFFFGDGNFIMPKFHFENVPQVKQMFPKGEIRTFRLPDGEGARFFQFDDTGAEIRADVRKEVEKALEKANVPIDKLRSASDKKTIIRDSIKLKPAVKVIRITT